MSIPSGDFSTPRDFPSTVSDQPRNAAAAQAQALPRGELAETDHATPMDYVLALLIGMAAGLVSYFKPLFPFFGDSVSYIEQARSFLERGVFEVTPFGTEQPDVEAVPETLFPPGFPLLIALCSFVSRLPAEICAAHLNLAALVLLPATILMAFHRIVGRWPSLAIGMLAVFTSAAVRHGYLAYSDFVSLVLVVYLVHRLIRCGDKYWGWFWLGLLAGFAYLVRNANLCVILGIGLYWAWGFATEPENRRKKIAMGFCFTGGIGLIVAPWLVRNWLVFGKLQPYQMPPSTVGLMENIQDYIAAQWDTLLTFNTLDAWLARNPSGWAFLLLILGTLGYWAATGWRRWPDLEKRTFLICGLVTGLGAAMVIAARTKYQWGVHIDGRYTLPFAVFLPAAVWIVIKNRFAPSTARLGLSFLLLTALMLGRAQALDSLYRVDPSDSAMLAAAGKIKAGRDEACAGPAGGLAVSNFSVAYRVLCGTRVRAIWFQPERAFIESSLQEWSELGKTRGILVSVFPWRDEGPNELPLPPEFVASLSAAGWQVLRNEREHLMLAKKAAPL